MSIQFVYTTFLELSDCRFFLLYTEIKSLTMHSRMCQCTLYYFLSSYISPYKTTDQILSKYYSISRIVTKP